MPYTKNPHMPRVRVEAARLVIEKGWSTRKVARYTGFNQSSVVRWVNILRKSDHRHVIPTLSPRPHSHPRELSQETVQAILHYRLKYNRCAEVVHHMMLRDGHKVSLSSVKRTIKRAGLTKFSKWKKWHQYDKRPIPERPGILVQIDTIVDGPHDDRLYIYTMLDVCTRWSFAMPVERFNRTIQEECLQRFPKTLIAYQKAIPDYLNYYNNERPHMSINMQTPKQVMQSY